MLYRHIARTDDPNYLVEKRMWDRICDRKISGKFDAIYLPNMYDYKRTSVWKKMFGDHTAWEEQQNLYCYLCGLVGIEITGLHIIAWYKDWDKTRIYETGYPKDRVELIKLKRWSTEDQKAFLEYRIELQKQAEDMPDDELPPCSSKDMWEKPTKYAVYAYKNNVKGKRASRVVDTEEQANSWIKWKQEQTKQKTDYRIEFRPGSRLRCESYCSVNVWCNQYKNYKLNV